MYLLEENKYLWLLLIIPVVWLFFWLLVFWKKRTRRKFADKELLKRLSPNTSFFKSALKVGVLSLAIAAIVIALVNPKFGTKTETLKREGVDIVFAVDVSKSMLAEDIAPNRLEKSKQLVTQIINEFAGDRVGIIAYAASAFPQLPITTDYGAAKMFLQSMNTEMLSSQGTAINEAIELAKTYYNEADQTSKVLFILSDGEDHARDIVGIAEEAAREEIRIFTIGVGTEKGGPIPIKRNGVVQTYKKDQEGNTVITRKHEDILKEIAEKTDGQYIEGGVTEEVVTQVKEILQNLDKKEYETQQIESFRDQFQWFLGLALFLLFLDVFLLERRTAWLRKLNLFNEKRQ